jgi:hypothetical protein
MRRVVWSVLTGLGVFFIVAAFMFRFFTPGQAIKFPLNQHTIVTLQGTGTYFSQAQLQELAAVNVQVTETVLGDVGAADAAGSSHIAVWRSFASWTDTTNHARFVYQSSRLPFDRKTGVLVHCCGATASETDISGRHGLNISGQSFVWPIGTQKKTYQVFDPTLGGPTPYSYAGTEVVNGITTYKFVTHIPNTAVGTETVPASLVGLPGIEVTLPEYYSATKVVWVDPVTGAPIRADERGHLALQDSTGTTRLVLFDGDLVTTPASVASLASQDKSYQLKDQIVKIVVPVSAGVLGLILLVAGLVLSRRATDDEYEESDDFDDGETYSSPA